jgi:CelD/BcsL family acetyltransferase involved in cellulose biosynthesis/dTDP-4-amino-4,6-dideoxygalactose transaminase
MLACIAARRIEPRMAAPSRGPGRLRGGRLSAWPPLPPEVWARPACKQLPFPLGDDRCRLYSRGRHALWHGLRASCFVPGTAVLVPAYHHGSEIEVFVSLGIECRFYSLTDRLEPDEEALDTLLTPDVRALHIIHYLGYPQDAMHWRRWCEERGLLLIEDAAMAWLAETPDGPVGSHGDMAIFCLYKSFGLPDGAALISRNPPGPNPRRGPAQVRAIAALHLAWVAQHIGRASLLADGSTPPNVGYVPERDFALEDPDSPLGAATRRLLPRVAGSGVAARRRANARVLLESLGDCVIPPFDDVPAGAAPFAFPIQTPDKAAVLERLDGWGIAALDFWSAPHPALPVDRFPSAATRRATTVGLPVHQELRPGDLERIVTAARRRSAKPVALRVEGVATIEEAREPWQALAFHTRNVFATWEWASTWWRHFGREGTLRLMACESPGGEPVAVLPLCVASEHPLHMLRFVGHGPADQLEPVCAPKDAPAAARALRRSLRDCLPRWDLFVCDRIPADQGWGALLGARVTAREQSPVVDIRTTDWDSFLAARSSSLRKQIRYQERRLEREHDLRYRLSVDPDRLDEDFDLLCNLHERRWASGESDAFSAGRRPFLREFARCSLERGWLRLWFLELDGEAVAAWLGFRFCGVESYYQGGRDPAWRDRSVGAVLVAHTLRAAVRDGMTEYRFLRGGEAYKDRFATRDPSVETLVVPGTVAGRAALTAAGLRRLASGARRTLVQAYR